VLVNASADFVEPLIFTNIKLIVARLFYERENKTFTDFRLSFNLMFVHHMLSKGTWSWSSDKLTMFQEKRWEFQRFENLIELWPTYCSPHKLPVAT